MLFLWYFSSIQPLAAHLTAGHQGIIILVLRHHQRCMMGSCRRQCIIHCVLLTTLAMLHVVRQVIGGWGTCAAGRDGRHWVIYVPLAVESCSTMPRCWSCSIHMVEILWFTANFVRCSCRLACCVVMIKPYRVILLNKWVYVGALFFSDQDSFIVACWRWEVLATAEVIEVSSFLHLYFTWSAKVSFRGALDDFFARYVISVGLWCTTVNILSRCVPWSVPPLTRTANFFNLPRHKFIYKFLRCGVKTFICLVANIFHSGGFCV